MAVEQDAETRTEVFKLNKTDLNHLLRRADLKGNNLSPLALKQDTAEEANEPSSDFATLAQNPLWESVASKLLEPDLKVTFTVGGSDAQEDTYYALSRNNDPALVLLTPAADSNYILIHFADQNIFWEWWINTYATITDNSYERLFEGDKPLEVLVCALHALDTYRRLYMVSMLNYQPEIPLTIGNDDFLDAMKAALVSGDTRWLLPTLFSLCPTLTRVKLKLLPEHIQEAEKAGLLGHLQQEGTEEPLLLLGEKAQMMGKEFLKTWLGSIAIEAVIFNQGRLRRVSTLFLAPTALTNHLFSFRRQQESYSFRHLALNSEELTNTLSRYFKNWQGMLSSPPPKNQPQSQIQSQPKKEEPRAAKQEEPQVLFCGNCGQPVEKGQKFCGNCGKAL